MHDVAGFIAAGGRSSRMGEDKAWLDLAGRPMIEHVIAAVKRVTGTVSIISNDARYSRLGLPVYSDINIGVGPLEAIRTALANSRASRALVVACDLPLVSSELFRLLIGIPGSHQAVVPVGLDGELETLCALYRAEALEPVNHLIAAGEHMVRRLFDLIPTCFVRFEQIRHLAGSEHFFENVNSREDYERVANITGAILANGPGHS